MPVVMKWDTAHHVFALDNMISRMVEWTSDLMQPRDVTTGAAWIPAADMYETDDAIMIRVELPGIDQDSVEIFLQDDYVFLRGERQLPPQMQAAKILRVERLYGRFQRVFQLPYPVDVQHASASYEQGMLHICLSKSHLNAVSGQIKIAVTT